MFIRSIKHGGNRPHRSFAILDVVGITTAYNINKWRLKNRGFKVVRPKRAFH
jgi:hypothetical protein